MNDLRQRGLARAAAAGVVILLCCAWTPAEATGVAVHGTSSAVVSTEPEFSGYWFYTIDLEWDLRALPVTHVSPTSFSLHLGLWECLCACDEEMVVFPDIAGEGVVDGPCPVTYSGGYHCKMDPELEEPGAQIMFDISVGTCRPSATGSARLRFYSRFRPDESVPHADALLMRAGETVATGTIDGPLPSCECNSAAQPASWGMLKALYR